MTPDTLAHIRADVQTAAVENRNDDPALLPDLLNYLLTELGVIATQRACICPPADPHHFDGPDRECPEHGEPLFWATAVLERCQVRATSQIPFGEPADPDDDTDWIERG